MSDPPPKRLRRWTTRAVRRQGLRRFGSAVVSTMWVRLLGLIAQAYAVRVFGASADLDAYYITLVPVSLAVVPLGGAIELAYVGRLEAARQRGRADWAFERLAFRARCIRMSVVTTVGLVMLAPVLVRVASPAAGEGRHELATELAWYVFPSALPWVVSLWSSTVLIASGRVHLPVVAQAARPVVLIAALLTEPASVHALGAAVLIGAVLELAIGVAFVRRAEDATPWGWRSRAPDEPQLRGLVLSSAGAQAVPAVDQAFAAGIGPGTLVVLNLATRFYDVARGAMVAPSARLAHTRMSEALRTGRDRFRESAARETRRAAFVGILAGAVTALLAPIVVHGAFTNANFTDQDGRRTVILAVLFAIAIVPFSIVSLLPRALMLVGRSQLVSRMLVLHLLLNIALDAVLVAWLNVYGIALATATSLLVLVVAESAALRRALSSQLSVATADAGSLTDPTRPPLLEAEQRPQE